MRKKNPDKWKDYKLILGNEIYLCNRKSIEEDKEYILEHGPLSVHHSLGRWIRNNWGLWENDSILKFNMVKLGFIHPDDISNYIIEEFIKYEKHK